MSRLLKHGRVWLATTLCLLATLHISAQSRQPWEEYLMQSGLIEDIENEDISERYDELCELAANPINLNHSTPEQLRQLPFITPEEYLRLVEYIDKVGEVHTWAELLVADITDKRRMRLLQYFAYLGEPASNKKAFSLNNILKYGKHEAMGYFKLPCYDRRGDDHGYLGYPYRHWVRYTFNYGQDVKVGLVGAQDAGEPFFSQPNSMGYDYYSFYIQLQNRGWLRSLVVGRYRLRIGSGLVMNTNYSFGKLSALNGLGRQSTVISGHSSRSEANYLQGVAATANLSRHLSLTAFFSHRLIDATLNKDSATVKTILKTGYHRTASEMARRRNTSQTVGGASMAVRSGGFTAALSAMGTTFNRQLRPDTSAVFRRFYPKGQRFGNASLSYSYLSPRLQVAGEAAVASSGGMATLNTVAFAPSPSLSLRLVYRYYSYRYHSLFASAFSDGGNVSNEQGVYLGMAWRPVAPLLLTAYADYARFPWPRYMVSFASRSWDGQLAATLSLNRLTLNARYRVRLRQRDNAKHTGLTDRTEQRLRLSAIVQHDVWRLATQADMALASADSTSKGYMVMQSGGFKTGRLTVDGNVAYFHTDSYDSRLYVYERGLLYNFSFPMFYGEGLHYALRVRYDFTRRLMFMAKASVTNHLDRSTIGSGLQRINRSSQTDVEMQVRWKF